MIKKTGPGVQDSGPEEHQVADAGSQHDDFDSSTASAGARATCSDTDQTGEAMPDVAGAVPIEIPVEPVRKRRVRRRRSKADRSVADTIDALWLYGYVLHCACQIRDVAQELSHDDKSASWAEFCGRLIACTRQANLIDYIDSTVGMLRSYADSLEECARGLRSWRHYR